MESSERAMLIRRGNELFNARDFKNALKIFMATSYQDGLIRIAKILENEKKDRVAALKIYKHAGMQGDVDRLAMEMAQTIRFLIKEDKEKQALEQGQNYNAGYKISGQAPTMLPHETVAMVKKKLGIKESAQSWEPVVISRDELSEFRKNKDK